MRQSGALTLEMARVSVALQGQDGSPVSTLVGVARIKMRSGSVFLQFICGYCGRRAQVLRLHAGHIMCGRCAIGARASPPFVALSIRSNG
jgi:hypothetical protein